MSFDAFGGRADIMELYDARLKELLFHLLLTQDFHTAARDENAGHNVAQLETRPLR